ncbi:hypothetical protein EQG49_09015 [Periweissella cryptocerci]|uniref:DNA/RNA non-specific endonuclease n=1 Tax=Periweissella cryptocerci TaxID=2506420 RepID=A0A4P6YUY1_9LACO|nr:hypothetical protein [Periweissella cryptocerci]QBO36604.1 hypothetical protein EQG49_09015 [Periweissella cryptocerci]
MKKIMLMLGLVTFVVTIALTTSACSASTEHSVHGVAGIVTRNSGEWKTLSKKKQKEISKPIPKKYRGTWYTWNVFKNRKERVQIKARSLEYAYRTKKGKYVALDRYQGNKLAAWTTKYGHLSVNYILKNKSGGKYKFFEENFTLNRTKQGVRITIPANWNTTINYNKKVTFRKKMKKPVMGNFKMTKAFLYRSGHLSPYSSKYDTYYTWEFNKKMTRFWFNVQAIWNGDGPNIDDETVNLNAGGADDAYSEIKSASFEGNKVTLIILPPISITDDGYYKIQLKRISRRYMVVEKITNTNERFNGKKVYSTPSLFGVRFVDSELV